MRHTHVFATTTLASLCVIFGISTVSASTSWKWTRPLCGNGVVEKSEQCDDGNRKSRDGCSSLCKIEQQCNGYWQGQSYPAADQCNVCTCTSQGERCTKRPCRFSSSSRRSSVSSSRSSWPSYCQPYICSDGRHFPTCTADGRGVIDYFRNPCEPLSSSSQSSLGLCTSSYQCPSGQRCSTERGDCQSACRNPGDICPAVCMGICEPKPSASCGNGMCEEGEGFSCPKCDTPNMCPMAACRIGSCPSDCY